ncbi:hypothetical protein AXG93_2354s1030 [Marchantia polymorpha subsp. ruderalis]|uniref:Uncharacterized protein n=1 Tax=Marchantia polymorpha subsp. ruderalis TaxID=1480154 RepID=A0A176WSQ0_MARPO|nr:hypothetical protein AXG93_2354s1030 [Marchantia polymorpha subsp. ruderalis]
MKARQLILEANSNMENRAAASQGQSTPGTELNEETVVREKKVPVEKYLRTSTVSPTPVVTRRAMRKQKGKANMMEEVSQGQDQVTSAGIRMRVPSEKPAKVLAVSSDTKEDLVAMKTIVERVVEDVIGETAAPQKVVSSRTSTGTVILKSEKDPSAKKIQSQVKTQKWLQLRDLKRRAAAMIMCSVSGQHQLARKLDAFLTSLCDAILNLELELAADLRELGLD